MNKEDWRLFTHDLPVYTGIAPAMAQPWGNL